MSYFDRDRRTNFAEETIGALAMYKYTVDDIDWIGNYYFEIPIHEFFDVARKTNYYSGYGSAEMPTDLLIVMKDGSWFKREEYDGSEWWHLVRIPARSNIVNHLKVHDFTEGNYEWDPTLIEACVKKG